MATPEADIRRLAIARRVIYVLVAATVVVPYFVPLPIPFEPDPWARKLFDRMDQLPAGSHVLLAFDYDPASRAELYPMSKALLRHCFKKDLVPIVMTHWQTGLGLAEELCVETAAESKKMWGKEKISGRDYVFLGFRPGYVNLVLLMGQSIKTAFPKDYFNKPTQGMEALKGADSLKDIDLGIDVAAGATVDGVWIPYGSDRFGFPLGAGCTGVIAPDLYPFLQSKQLVGFLGGLRGAADYEVLLKKPGTATPRMQVQSATHLLIIGLVLFGNAVEIARRLRRKKGK